MRIIAEHYTSARHPETQEWDDHVRVRVIEAGYEWRKKRITEIRFSSGEVFDTSVVAIEQREKPTVSVDID